MIFWLLTLGLAAAIAALLGLGLVLRRGDQRELAEFDIAVYRDQLAELDRDTARGVVTADTAERTRLEISRKILEADKARGSAKGDAPAGLNWIAAGLSAAFLIGGAAIAYLQLGQPGYGDLPLQHRLSAAEDLRENRPSQSEAEAQAAPNMPPPAEPDPQYAELIEKLRATVAERPDDPRGLQLLAQNEASLGNFSAAAAAQGKLLEIAGDNAPAGAFAEHADLLVMAAGGYVSPEAEAALEEALARDPQDGTARYYVGLMFAQTGRPDLAFRYWRALLEQSPADAPWIPAIRAQIGEAAMRAGVEYQLPSPTPPTPGQNTAPRGPNAADIAAAQEMSAEDRQAMIETMVEGLAERLASEGGAASDWARLIAALGVLGQTDRAKAIWQEAQGVFAADENGLAAINGAAAQAGLSQ
ncbi:MAG: c-type cytochrome biogenesis protein CcmI [Mangrovicoccus sp.]